MTHLHEHLHPVQRSRPGAGHGARHGPGGQLLPPQTARLLLFCKLIRDGQTLANVQHLQQAASFHFRMCLLDRSLVWASQRHAGLHSKLQQMLHKLQRGISSDKEQEYTEDNITQSDLYWNVVLSLISKIRLLDCIRKKLPWLLSGRLYLPWSN